MRMRVAESFVLTFAGMVATSAHASALPDFVPCEYDEVRPISFTNVSFEDEAQVQIIGDDCPNSVLLVTIRDDSNTLLFAHSAILHKLTPAEYWDSVEETGIVAGVWSMLGPRRTGELQPWKERQEIYDLFGEIPLLGREEYEAARAYNRPYICVQTYYEGADCYWVNPERGVEKLLRLSD